LQISNSTDISKHETGVRLPIRQWYCDALSVLRRMMLVETGPPRQRSLNDVEYHSSSARRSAKRRHPAPSPCASQPGDVSQHEQIQNFAMAAMISQMQSLTQKIEAAAQRVEEVSDKAEAAEQTALKMAELTALAATELAAFAATDQAKIIGFREAPRRRGSYGYSPNMDA
jgi:hypothetical protein